MVTFCKQKEPETKRKKIRHSWPIVPERIGFVIVPIVKQGTN